jgi:hypothetical protein
MAAFEACEGGAAERRRRPRRQRLDDAGMRSLGGRQPAGDCFRLRGVGAAVEMLERVDGRQHHGRAEPPRQPDQGAGAEARAQSRHLSADRLEPAPPELGMCLLDRGEPRINPREFGILLAVRQCAVECGTVDLALQIGGIAILRVGFWHRRPRQVQPQIADRRLPAPPSMVTIEPVV